MGEKNFQTGDLFIRGYKGEFEPLKIGSTEEIGQTVEEVYAKQPIVKAVDSGEVTLSCNIDIKPLAAALKKAQRAWDLIMISSLCPNRRVAYLAKHAKRARVRKKNYNRGRKLANKSFKKLIGELKCLKCQQQTTKLLKQ